MHDGYTWVYVDLQWDRGYMWMYDWHGYMWMYYGDNWMYKDYMCMNDGYRGVYVDV